MITDLNETHLAKFTGRPLDYFGGPFVVEALEQSGDLFQLATDRTELPAAETIEGRLARRGVLAMAEAFIEGNKSRDLRFSPFKSETIGSYTYTLAEQNVLAGVPTGISWFDIAVSRLALDIGTGVSNSSISAFDRLGDIVSISGRDVLIGPADVEDFAQGRPRISGWQPL